MKDAEYDAGQRVRLGPEMTRDQEAIVALTEEVERLQARINQLEVESMASASNLNFEGGGRISVSVDSLVKSEQFRAQLQGIRDIATTARHSFICAACGVSLGLAHTVSCEEAVAAVAEATPAGLTQEAHQAGKDAMASALPFGSAFDCGCHKVYAWCSDTACPRRILAIARGIVTNPDRQEP